MLIQSSLIDIKIQSVAFFVTLSAGYKVAPVGGDNIISSQRASFTKQGKLAWEHNYKVPMGGKFLQMIYNA